MRERIYLSAPHMGGEEIKFVHEAFASNWISPAGPNLTAFEKELSDRLEGISVAALSSGTAAIHLALILAGVEQGDEVICSTFTFSGTCNPILYQKAVPVFVDSESDTWNMDPMLLRAAILDRIKKGKKPKVVIVVHLYGMPAKMAEIVAIAREFELIIIEDAAEALGSIYQGRPCGVFGDFGILSFNGNKIITTSGGGALTSNNSKKIEKARFLATQARDPAPHYQHSEVGYNYRLSNISAGIGRGQLRVLEDRVEKRRQIFEWYQQELHDLELDFQLEITDSRSNRWLTCVDFKGYSKGVKDSIREALEAENIESRPLWKPMQLQPIFEKYPFYGSGFSERLFENGLCLPSGSVLTKDNVTMISRRIKSILTA